MAKRRSPRNDTNNPFALQLAARALDPKHSDTHVYGKKSVCRTDGLGHTTPHGQSLTEIRVDTHEGFVPLWAQNITLRWRFQDKSLARFADPDAAKATMRGLLGRALVNWGKAVPVKFSEQRDNCDFEIVVRANADCDASGCVLASSFFPDGGQHEFVIYPTYLEQSEQEQLETLEHELGHVFGLRHWFANISETDWSSELFGSNGKFTIMNYGAESKLMPADKKDLAKLYRAVWSRALTEINGTPVRLFKPFSSNL